MAQLFRPNGDAQPVFALDIANGAQTGNIAPYGNVIAQPQGPKLDFYAITVENASNQAIDLRNECGNVNDPGVVQTILQAIQQTGTIAIYGVQNATTGKMSIAIYPNAGYTAATLTTAIQGLGNVQITNSSGQVRGVDVSGSDAVATGFNLT